MTLLIEPSSPITAFSAAWLGVRDSDLACTVICGGIIRRATSSQAISETAKDEITIRIFCISFFIKEPYDFTHFSTMPFVLNPSWC
jgi:hypothetical protein